MTNDPNCIVCTPALCVHGEQSPSPEEMLIDELRAERERLWVLTQELSEDRDRAASVATGAVAEVNALKARVASLENARKILDAERDGALAQAAAAKRELIVERARFDERWVKSEGR